MCVLYVSFGSKVRPRIFWCIAMDSAVLFILRSRLLLYFAGSGLTKVQVVFSGFSVRLQFIYIYLWLYVFLGCTCACVCRCDGDVICIDHDLSSGWWYVCSHHHVVSSNYLLPSLYACLSCIVEL